VIPYRGQVITGLIDRREWLHDTTAPEALFARIWSCALVDFIPMKDIMTSRWLHVYRYFKVMFPLGQYGPVAVAHFLAMYGMLHAGSSQEPLPLGWPAVAGVTSVFLFSLLMRLYDEEKDVETDRRLAESGDPWFQHRPQVTDDQLISDLRWLRHWTLVFLIAVNLLMGVAIVWLACALLILLAWLSSKWFFIPGMRQNLFLALVTHNPLALAVDMYVATVAFSAGILTHFSWWIVPLLVGLWLPITAWELSRKIRMPEDETAYQTYSQVFGLRMAGILPAICTVVSAVCLCIFMQYAQIDLGWQAIVGVVAIMVTGRYLLFAFGPTRARARLKPAASLYAAAANIAPALGSISALGVRWAW